MLASLAFASTACGTTSSSYGTRHALLVGILDYDQPKQGAVRRVPDLGGPDNDVTAIAAVLEARFGFDEDHITILRDHDATRARILEALETLATTAKAGDSVVFQYSGHGSQVASPSEPDGRDETLVPADAPKGVPDITDNTLRGFYVRILKTGAKLTVLMDSCHSGDAFRSVRRARKVEPGAAAAPKTAAPGGNPLDLPGFAFIGAARSDELAFEDTDVHGKDFGALTLALLSRLRSAPASESFDTLGAQVAAALLDSGQAQHPVVRMSPDRRGRNLIGEGPGADDRVRVAMIGTPDGERIALRGGYGIGLAPGTLLANADGTVEVAVSTVALTISHAKVTKGKLASLKKGAMFVVTRFTSRGGAVVKLAIPPPLDGLERTTALALVQALAAELGADWVKDPIITAPATRLRWTKQGWVAKGPGKPIPLGRTLERKSLMEAVGSARPLFVDFPLDSAARGALLAALKSITRASMVVTDLATAQYRLVGGLTEGENVGYQWHLVDIPPVPTRRGQAWSTLPLRPCKSAPTATSPKTKCGWHSNAGVLAGLAYRLAAVRAWLSYPREGSKRFPYSLAIRQVDSPPGTWCKDALATAPKKWIRGRKNPVVDVVAGKGQCLVLRAYRDEDWSPVTGDVSPRVLQLVTISWDGTMVPIGPASELKRPTKAELASPHELILNMRVVAPEPTNANGRKFDTDTMLLLSSDNHVDPSLLSTTTTSRGRGPLVTEEWSLHRLTVQVWKPGHLPKK